MIAVSWWFIEPAAVDSLVFSLLSQKWLASVRANFALSLCVFSLALLNAEFNMITGSGTGAIRSKFMHYQI